MTENRPSVSALHLRPSARESGFTVLELLTVLAIIAILTTVVVGAGRFATETSRTARTRAELAVIAAALADYKLAFGDYPRTDDPASLLQALLGRLDPSLRPATTKSFLETHRFATLRGTDPRHDTSAPLVDAWERPYRYVYRPAIAGTSLHPTFILYSTGPDGADFFTPSQPNAPDRTRIENLDNLYAGEPR